VVTSYVTTRVPANNSLGLSKGKQEIPGAGSNLAFYIAAKVKERGRRAMKTDGFWIGSEEGWGGETERGNTKNRSLRFGGRVNLLKMGKREESVFF